MEKFLKSRQEGSVWWNEAGDQQENCTKKQNKKQTISFKGPNVCRQLRVSHQWSYECGRRGQLFITDQQEQRERERETGWISWHFAYSLLCFRNNPHPALFKTQGGGGDRDRDRDSLILLFFHSKNRQLDVYI